MTGQMRPDCYRVFNLTMQSLPGDQPVCRAIQSYLDVSINLRKVVT